MWFMWFIGSIIAMALYLYSLIIILEVGLSWLVALEIVNKDNEAAKKSAALLARFTEPAYVHLRKYIPPVGGLDISPLILLIGVNIIGSLLTSMFFYAH